MEEKKEIERNEIGGEKDDQIERKKLEEKKNEKKIKIKFQSGYENVKTSAQKIQPNVFCLYVLCLCKLLWTLGI